MNAQTPLQNDVASPEPPKVQVGRRQKKKEVDAKPEICVEKDGDRVTQIKITCSCGEIITVNCSYPEAA